MTTALRPVGTLRDEHTDRADRIMRAVARLDSPELWEIMIALEIAEHEVSPYRAAVYRLVEKGLLVRSGDRQPYAYHVSRAWRSPNGR